MGARFSYRNWYVALAALVLALALVACAPFGRSKAATETPTETPSPTETPLPVLPTYTPTKVVVPTSTPRPTSTPTTVVEGETATPTVTPTPEPPVGAAKEEPAVAAATYKTLRVPEMGTVIRNGSFEEGFSEQGVGQGWTAFSNDAAVYVWLDESAPQHVSHGSHAQLMRTMGPGEADRFVGVYQTVDVVAGETYTLAVHGLIRSSTSGRYETPYGHRVQWAIDYSDPSDWYAVNQDWAAWTDTGWNDIKLDAKEPVMNSYVQTITPDTDKLTLYIRGWTKWPILGSEAAFYVDGVFLNGPVPGDGTVVRVPAPSENAGEEGMPTTGGSTTWIPILGVLFVLGFALWEVRKVWSH